MSEDPAPYFVTPTCTCPRRMENGQIVRCGRDVMCPVHGDPAPHAAHQPLLEVKTATVQSAGCDAIAEAQRQIIQTPAREALRAAADLPGERYD